MTDLSIDLHHNLIMPLVNNSKLKKIGKKVNSKLSKRNITSCDSLIIPRVDRFPLREEPPVDNFTYFSLTRKPEKKAEEHFPCRDRMLRRNSRSTCDRFETCEGPNGISRAIRPCHVIPIGGNRAPSRQSYGFLCRHRVGTLYACERKYMRVFARTHACAACFRR